MPWAIKSVENLAPGMKVARDVDVRGMVLLTANTILNEAHIQQLRKWCVNSIAILEGGDAAGADAIQSDDSYLQEKARLESLFAATTDDKQMEFLKNCLLKHLEVR